LPLRPRLQQLDKNPVDQEKQPVTVCKQHQGRGHKRGWMVPCGATPGNEFGNVPNPRLKNYLNREIRQKREQR
jgi:hypothetical protein